MNISLKTLKSDKYSLIHNSKLYKNFTEDSSEEDVSEEDDDDDIFIPYICTKKCSDMNLILKTIDYWGINQLPFNFFDRILEEKPLEELMEIHSRTRSDEIKFLIDICNSPEDYIFSIAFTYSRNDCIPFLYQSGLKCKFNNKVPGEFFKSIPTTFEEILDMEDSFYLDMINDFEKFKKQSEYFLYEIFEFNYKKCIKHLINIRYKYICEGLSQFGLLEHLKNAFSQGLPINRGCINACGISGNVETLEYILNNSHGFSISYNCIKNAVDNDNTKILNYINKNYSQELSSFKTITGIDIVLD